MGNGTDTTTDAATFPIVAIGASAGGLEALRQLFGRLPADTGMAFVVIQHLDPGRPSMLASVLAGELSMPVREVTTDLRAQPNRVYVIPPSSDLSIDRGILTLVPRRPTGQLHLPINSFFRALAADSTTRAIGVVLSGSASDGTDGLRAIKAAGGITCAQEPASAQFPSMPESALAAGVVDVRASPEEIASELIRLSHHPYLARQEPPSTDSVDAGAEADLGDRDSVAQILTTILEHANADFRYYKRPTILRRTRRRMALRRLGSLSEYATLVRDDPEEARALAQDVLIHVTSFFRDPEVFAALEQKVLPEIVAHKEDGAAIRVWVPGCSTGQEAYSLAMCLVEALTDQRSSAQIKIFGSDLSEQAIVAARAGLYTEADLEGVSPARVDRFFDRAEGRYRVGKRIRDLCVFVRHDLTRDPPFAKLDLISCRNVLIYFGAELQRRVVSLLHHCLDSPGYLLLGSSEGVRELDDLFAPVDREHRIFLKTGQSPPLQYPLALGREAESKLPLFPHPQRPQHARDAQRQADHLLLARYAPSGVVVDDQFEIVQFRGHTGAFLESPPGRPQTNLLKLARRGLAGPLRETLTTAQAQSITVRKQGVRVTGAGAVGRSLDLEVIPLTGGTTAQHYFLVIFEEPVAPGRVGGVPGVAPGAEPDAGSQSDGELPRLRAELATSRAYVQAITGEYQDTVEELGAANEELIAANEELQSTNEELQSAKEELQSTNEELSTLNDELQNRNRELDVVASDLVNVLESVKIPVIMVDHAMRVRRFTPTARQVSSLQPGDVGRSLDDVKLKLQIDDLVDRVRAAIEAMSATEHEVQGLDGRWFRLHIRPYRTADNRLDGAVLSFLDVDVLKRAAQEAERARDYAQGIVETVPIALVVLDRTLRIVSANPVFRDSFGAGVTPSEHPALLEIAGGAFDVPALRNVLEPSVSARTPFRGLGVHCAVPGAGTRDLVVTGCPIRGAGGDLLLLVAIEDSTERNQLEASEKHARVEAEHANRAKDLFLATLSHELRTPLSTILMSAQMLQMTPTDDPRIHRASAAIERAVGNQARLIDDLLDISRIVAGKLMLDLEAVDLAAVVQTAVDVAQAPAEAKGIELALDIRGALRPVHGDPTRLQQVVSNLLTNAIKFTPRGGRISVSLDATESTARIEVRDTGLGLRPEMIPHLFDRFVQAESSMTRAHGGLGLGLAIVRHLVDVHGGEVHAESRGEGQGATFTVTLPLSAKEPPVPDITRRTVARSISNIRVLLVEDDDDTRQVCADMLAAHGADVRAVPSVREGLAALERFLPDVILCDIAMPGEDGYAFIRRLRSGNRGRDIPAAALTALAGEDDRRRALEAGFQLHLAKPIDADRLVVAIATLAAWPEEIPTPAAD